MKDETKKRGQSKLGKELNEIMISKMSAWRFIGLWWAMVLCLSAARVVSDFLFGLTCGAM